MARKRLTTRERATRKAHNAEQRRLRAVGVPPAAETLPAVIPPPLHPAVAAELALQDRLKKQKWTGLPKKSKIRAKAAMICALRIQGKTREEISQELGIAERTINQYMWIAGKNGWLTNVDPHEDAEFRLLHRVSSNLDEWLHARNKDTGLPDKEVTLEAAKGFGLFKDHSKPEMVTAQQANLLTINVVMPEGPQTPMRTGTTAGVPAYSEGEVVHV